MMSEAAITSSVLVSLFLIGFVAKGRSIRSSLARREFAYEFRNKLITYANSRGSDHATYHWLMFHSVRMQREMGAYGVMSTYTRAGSRQTHHNFPVILNMLPDLQQAFQEPMFAYLGHADQYARTMTDCLTRYMGVVEEARINDRSELKNPLTWFRDGVRSALGLPIQLLGWFGVISGALVVSITSAAVFRLLAGAVAVIGFVSAIVGLVTGWAQFVAIVERFSALRSVIGLITN